MPRTVAAKRAAFRALHESGCFMLPNPWDVGSARYLETLGFKALATTSSGFAWSKGHADNHVTRDAVLAHLREIVDATDLPVNADFESGFGATPDDVAQSVKLAVATGVAGLSIEDSTSDASAPLFPVDVAVARMKAARRAIDETGGDTLLVGRAENFFAGRPDIDDAIARLKAYADAGGLPLCARHQDARAHRGRGEGRGIEAGESADRRRVGIHLERCRGARRAARERRRRACARRLGRIHARGARARRWPVRRLQGRGGGQ